MNIDTSEPQRKIFPLKFSPPKQGLRRSPVKTPAKDKPRRKGVQKFVDGLKSNKSLK